MLLIERVDVSGMIALSDFTKEAIAGFKRGLISRYAFRLDRNYLHCSKVFPSNLDN